VAPSASSSLLQGLLALAGGARLRNNKMKITKSQLRKIVSEAIETTRGPKKWPLEYPAKKPASLTTADMSAEEFVQMIKDWGASDAGPKHWSSEKLFEELSEEDLITNYKWLQQKVANAQSDGGLLPRKYMPVVKRGFVEDLFNRLKAGKLDVNPDWAPTSADVGGVDIGDRPGAGKEARFKTGKKTKKLAKKSKPMAIPPAPVKEILSYDVLHKFVKQVLTEVSAEEFARYKALKAQGFTPAEQSKFAAELPAENFPSLADFQAMDDPKKSKDYWLNKGEFDGKVQDEDQVEVKFGTALPDELTPSQDVVYADKIGWTLLRFGPKVMAPPKESDDPLTTPKGAPRLEISCDRH
jgi:hypothetical protein